MLHMQLVVTKRYYWHFIVWSDSGLHIEFSTQDPALIQPAIPGATKFWRMRVLPELMGKWCTCTQGSRLMERKNFRRKIMENGATERRKRRTDGWVGVRMSHHRCSKWFHLQCVGMRVSTGPKGKQFCPSCQAIKYKSRKSNSNYCYPCVHNAFLHSFIPFMPPYSTPPPPPPPPPHAPYLLCLPVRFTL